MLALQEHGFSSRRWRECLHGLGFFAHCSRSIVACLSVLGSAEPASQPPRNARFANSYGLSGSKILLTIQRGQPRNSQENNTDTITSLSAREEEFTLKVARAKLTRPPKPPSELKFWLEVGWYDPTKELAVKKTKNEQNTKGETFLVRFEDDTNRTSALETKRFSVASADSSLSRREWLSIP